MTFEIIEEVDEIDADTATPTAAIEQVDTVDAVEEVDADWLSTPEVADPHAPHFAEPTPPPDPATLHFVDPDRKVVPARTRSDSGRWLDAHLLTILATVAAVPALRVPAPWVIACRSLRW